MVEKLATTLAETMIRAGAALEEEREIYIYMMELDPKYCDVIVRRYIEQVESDESIFLQRGTSKMPYINAVNL